MTVNKYLVATNRGLLVYKSESGEWEIQQELLSGSIVTSVSVAGNTIVAGTRSGIYRSENAGRTWSEASDGISYPIIRWVFHHPQQPERVFVGTEPAGVFVSVDGAQSWRECEEVTQMREKYRWSLPYSPLAGCVRGFAFMGERGYAAVEVGGVLRSDDYGDHWYLVEGGSNYLTPTSSNRGQKVNSDVHSIQTHPSSVDLIYAPTGGGFFRSRDGGKNWELSYNCYCREVWVDPQNPEHMILGPADGVDRMGRIERSLDGGVTWESASQGMQTPWSRHMVERYYQNENRLMFVLSNGDLIGADLDDLRWKTLLSGNERINSLTSFR